MGAGAVKPPVMTTESDLEANERHHKRIAKLEVLSPNHSRRGSRLSESLGGSMYIDPPSDDSDERDRREFEAAMEARVRAELQAEQRAAAAAAAAPTPVAVARVDPPTSTTMASPAVPPSDSAAVSEPKKREKKAKKEKKDK